MAIPLRYQRKHNVRETKKKYIIATEGEKTEDIYFSKFKEQNFRKNVFIKILPTKKDGDSAPEKVLKRVKKYAKDNLIDEKRDECWLVIDYDSWGDKKLNVIHKECQKSSYHLAVSNPCFELWLNLHQDNPKTPSKCSDCENELNKLLLGNYSKNDFDVDKLLKKLDKAIAKAKQLHKNKAEPFPKQVGTHVYLLVEKLNESEAGE